MGANNRIDNPINYRPPDELENNVKSFYEEHQLAQVVDINLLIRGAHLARDREQFLRDESMCDEVESLALKEEENPRLSRQPKELQVVLLACAIGAIVQYVLENKGLYGMWYYPPMLTRHPEDGRRQISQERICCGLEISSILTTFLLRKRGSLEPSTRSLIFRQAWCRIPTSIVRGKP